MALILLVVAHVAIAGLPLKNSMAMLLIILIHAFIGIALGVTVLICLLLLPFAVALLQSILELAGVTATILPLVLSEALRLADRILTNIAVTIGEEVRTISVPQTFEPFAFVFVTVGEYVNSVSFCLSCLPLADVGLTVSAFPDTIAMFDAHKPLSVVDLAVFPLIHALAICLTISVGAMVGVARGEKLVTPATSLVILPFTFVDASVRVNKDAEAFALSRITQLTSIDTVFVLLDAEIGTLANLFIIKFVTDHLIIFERVTIILEVTVLLA